MKLQKLVLSALASSVLLSANAMAADEGTITFEGLITETTCNVDIGGNGADATIPMRSAHPSELATSGRTAGDTRFVMNLTDCTGGLTAKAHFLYGENVTAEGRLSNAAATDPARNVTLQLVDGQDSSVINIGDYSQNSHLAGYVDITSGSASLPYTVRYHSEGGTTAGNVASSVEYRLTYR